MLHAHTAHIIYYGRGIQSDTLSHCRPLKLAAVSKAMHIPFGESFLRFGSLALGCPLILLQSECEQCVCCASKVSLKCFHEWMKICEIEHPWYFPPSLITSLLLQKGAIFVSSCQQTNAYLEDTSLQRTSWGFGSLAPGYCPSTLLQSERKQCVCRASKFLSKYFVNGGKFAKLKTRKNLVPYGISLYHSSPLSFLLPLSSLLSSLLQQPKKRVIFFSFPPVLHLHLMRFQYDPATDTHVNRYHPAIMASQRGSRGWGRLSHGHLQWVNINLVLAYC